MSKPFATSILPALKQARNKVFNVRWFGFAMAVRGPHSWGAWDEPARLMASIKENAASTSFEARAFTAAVQASTPGAHFPPLLPAVRSNRRAVCPSPASPQAAQAVA